MELIKRALAGEQQAFTQILDKYWVEVYNFIQKNVEQEADAEDIAITAFSKAFSKLDTYNPSYSFSTWLITIAKNVHYDMLRKKEIHKVEITDENSYLFENIKDNSPTVEDNIINEQNLQTLKQLIKKLKPQYQEIIHLKYFKELSYDEISNELNENISNVKVRLLRARNTLVDLINKHKIEK